MRFGARIVLGGGTVVAVALGAAGAATTASCTSGAYDGTFDAAGLETGVGADAASPPITHAIKAGAADTLATPDGLFEVDVPPGAFASDVSISVTYVGDRLLPEAPLSVPQYAVTVTPDQRPAIAVQVVFHGQSGGLQPSPGSVLVPVVITGDGETPLRLTGIGQPGGGGPGGSVTPYWGLVRVFGTFSLAFEQGIVNGTQVTEANKSACLAKCFGTPTLGAGSGTSTWTTPNGCFVQNANPNLSCFVESCSSLAAAAQRCLDLVASTQATGTVACGPSSGGPTSQRCQPSLGQQCCITGPNSHQCGGGGCTFIARCSSDKNCPSGTVCCATDIDTVCTTTCAPDRRVCGDPPVDGGAPECDGGACNVSKTCGFGTCGTLPAGCPNP